MQSAALDDEEDDLDLDEGHRARSTLFSLKFRENLVNKQDGFSLLTRKLVGGSRMLSLEKGSVYGAAIAIPQLARSSGWPAALIFLTVKVYMFFLMSCFAQAMLLHGIQKEENIMDVFSGQMNLCDFGAPLDGCPDDPICAGPGGTQISGPRLYAYSVWSIRTFVRQSIEALHPDRAAAVDRAVDPGEYGAESRLIRWFCCFIFMFEVMKEFILIVEMMKLFYYVPSAAEPWIYLVDNDYGEPERPRSSMEASETDRTPLIVPYVWRCCSRSRKRVDATEEAIGGNQAEKTNSEIPGSLGLRIAGIPLLWKGIYFILIFVPKVLLWRLLASTGITFLMETSAIQGMIVNSCGLAFILQVDESICCNLMATETASLVEDCADFEMDAAAHGDEDIDGLTFLEVSKMLPFRLVITFCLTAVGLSKYYVDKCEYGAERGFWYSRDVYLPATTEFTFLNTFFPNLSPVPHEKEVYWQMP